MALFSNKIESVKFVDRNEKTIEVLYKQKTDSNTHSSSLASLNCLEPGSDMYTNMY